MEQFKPAPVKPTITSDLLDKIDIRVGTIKAVEDIKNKYQPPNGVLRYGLDKGCGRVECTEERSELLDTGHSIFIRILINEPRVSPARHKLKYIHPLRVSHEKVIALMI
jgi:hypothetical protein